MEVFTPVKTSQNRPKPLLCLIFELESKRKFFQTGIRGKKLRFSATKSLTRAEKLVATVTIRQQDLADSDKQRLPPVYNCKLAAGA
jgi:hypothetical protein|tara:strand:+ start:859 stop:1116 length:258 start_codon:yes stop_codon:yes gene_type:complete